MKLATILAPAPSVLPEQLKTLAVDQDQAHIVEIRFMPPLRAYARRKGWKLRTRRASFEGQSFAVWRVK